MTTGGNQPEAQAGSALSGTVRLPGGRPAEGAAVTVTEPGTGRQVGAARTTADGTFRISLGAGGSYLLIVSSPGRRPAADLVTAPAGPGAGATVRRDVVLAGAGVLAGVARIGESGGPAAGALVTLTDDQGQVIATGTAGADGGYRLEGLEAGDYTLVGMASGLNPVACAVTVPGPGDLAFEAPGQRVAAIVTGPDGAPVAGAVVTLCGRDGTVARSVSDSRGRAAFDGIRGDGYTLAAEGWGPGVAVAWAEHGRETRADIQLGAPATGTSPGAAGQQDTWARPGSRFSAANN
jgi:hypothetical protein